MRCVVTGAAGFIGSHLANHLLEAGHEVTGIDHELSDWVNPGIRFRPGDIRDVLWHWLDAADCVFHLAAVSTTPAAMRDPGRCNDINVTGTLNVLEAARKAEVPRLVYSSSNVVYGAPTPYKVSKLAAEGYCEVYTHLYGLSTICLRYSNVFGSLRQNPENVIMSMRASALERGFIEVTGDGEQSRDFTNVADICRANVLAAGSDATGTVDICTGENRTMNEVAGMFGVPVKHVADRPGDIKHIRQDPWPAHDLLGFVAEVPFAEGMAPYLTGIAA